MIVQAHGIDVDITHEEFPDSSGHLVWKITGTAGESTHESKHTVGAQDDPRRGDPPSTEKLQAALDRARTRVAQEAAWKEHCRLNAKGVK